MATIAELKTRLQKEAVIAPSEATLFSSDFLETIINEAIVAHNAAYVVANLPAREIPLVMLLSRITVCNVRAQKWADDANVSGAGGYGADRNTPYYKNIDLAAKLRKEYELLAAQLGVSIASTEVQGQVTVSNLKVLDPVLNARVPLSKNIAPIPILVLGAVENAADGTITVTWTINDFEDFYRYRFALRSYVKGAAAVSVLDPTNCLEEATVPGISELASIVDATLLQKARSVKLTGLNTAANYYSIALIVETKAEEVSISNEILSSGAIAGTVSGSTFEGTNCRIVDGELQIKVGDEWYSFDGQKVDGVATALLNQTPE
jgi:hypothetical protein